MAEAEYERAPHRPPQSWSQAAAASERLERPPLLAYCRWREAEALVTAGPGASDVTCLGVGVPGLLGRLYGPAVDLVRRRRAPPPAVVDTPRGAADIDPWEL